MVWCIIKLAIYFVILAHLNFLTAINAIQLSAFNVHLIIILQLHPLAKVVFQSIKTVYYAQI